MLILSTVIITKAVEEQRSAIVSLLQLENLPVRDLPAKMENYFIAMDDSIVIGAVGLERYGGYGLLRSLVVSKAYRNKHIADRLVQAVELHAAGMGITELYLLTETADKYFERKGYDAINRSSVPETIQASSEFSHVCPRSAVVMRKPLDA